MRSNMEEKTQAQIKQEDPERFKKLAIKIKLRELEIAKKEWQKAYHRLANFTRNNFLNDDLTIFDINEKINEFKPSD